MALKVAILGGGVSALVAAWALVKSDPTAYEITVYQLGFRLGGKGASGRRNDPSIGADHRIEEHGLHLMFGFYDNLFRAVRDVYQVVYGDDTTWQSFFKTDATQIGLFNFTSDDKTQWDLWALPQPKVVSKGLPGDDNPPGGSVQTILTNVLNWLAGVAFDAATRIPGHPTVFVPPKIPTEPTKDDLKRIRSEIDGLTKPAPLPPPAPGPPGPAVSYPAYWAYAIEFMSALNTRTTIDESERAGDARRFQTLWDYGANVTLDLAKHAQVSADAWLPAPLAAALDFMGAASKGVFIDLVWQRDTNWFDLDRYDLATYIGQHGGDSKSPYVLACYDLVFAIYSQVGAGTMLQAALRAFFLFRGGITYKMQAGMGDTIFTPLYQALAAKNVTFKFFQRVVGLRSSDGQSVDSIDLEQQVRLDADYDPLIDVDVDIGGQRTLKCWPNEPVWSRLPTDEVARVKGKIDLENYWTPTVPGSAYTLHQGENFDAVILGISVAALPDICADLLRQDSAFADHVRVLATTSVATQALQLWTVDGKTPDALCPVLGDYAEPFDTIADMSHLLKAEAQPENGPTAIRYLCSPLFERGPVPPRSATGYPIAAQTLATANALEWMTDRAPYLWKSLSIDGSFDWSALYDSSNGTGADRLNAQFVSTPTNPSDRYVVSTPMSFDYRLLSNGTRFSNLYITGDWIKTSLSVGCAEAAAMAGVQAGRALSLESGSKTPVPRAFNDWIADVQPRQKGVQMPAPGVPYKQRDGELMTPPPYQLYCPNLFMSIVAADVAHLQAVCDNALNVGTVKYSPLGGFVVLYGATMTNFTLGAATPTHEAGVWIPVLADDGTTQKLQVYSPYVWIDSPTSAVLGHAVFGYMKQVAAVTVPDVGDPLQIAVSGEVLTPDDTDGLLKIQAKPIVNGGSQTTQTWAVPSNSQTTPAEIFALIVKAIQAFVTIPIDLTALLQGLTSVFLKQLPSASDSSATYLAIVNAAILPDVDSLKGATLTNDWTFQIPTYQMPRIVETLGLNASLQISGELEQTYTITPSAQLWATFRGTIETGTVVYTAPT